MKKPDWTDAKFEVVKPTRPPRRAPWFDWRNFLIVGGMTVAGTISALLRAHH